ncbi:MAG: hypothetical protein GX605_08535 [Chloroflexi bacterium]|nr:hypothetical protein [Chloroflexota bacterium]
MAYGRTISGPAAATELVGLFKQQLTACNLRPGELCVVATDTAWNPVYGAACLGAALDLGAEAYQLTLPHSHPLPSKSLGPAWEEADLLIFATTHRLHYCEAMSRGLARGLRGLAAMQPLPVLQRLTADADVIRRTKAGARRVANARRIRITSAAGTDLSMDKSGRPGVANYGAADVPGHLDFWGAAMVETAPLEGTLEGRLVLDVGDIVFHLGRYVAQPTAITFRQGKAVAFDGGLDAFLLRRYLESYGEESSLMAGHVSWGTDRRALWTAQTVQFPEPGAGGADSEAHYGNVQIEIGSNNDLNFRGRNVAKAHLGLCALGCNLWLDDEPIIANGQFVPEELK